MDQRIAIFGGTSGIGLAVAQTCADAGAEVYVAARRPEKLDHALTRIQGSVRGIVVDVRREAEVSHFFDQAGEFDHVISTVGWALKPTQARELRKDTTQDLFDTKYWGQFFIAKHAASRLTENGSITLTSGVLSTRPVAGFSILASINAGIEALVRTLALEFAPRRINTICPGFVDTGKLFADLSGETRGQELQKAKGDTLPTRRVGNPQDAAKAYLYALGNPYVTGQTLTIDGGASLL